MASDDAAAIYEAAQQRVEDLRLHYGASLGERLAAGFTDRGPAYHLTPEERATRRQGRHTAHAFDHQRDQFHADDERPPTYKQRQLIWCLGYRGPAPRTRAEVTALVAEFERRDMVIPNRLGH